MISSKDIRQKFIDFFIAKGHTAAPSSSLIPENDPTVLFTTAGMQQFKRYYLFPSEAPSTRITTAQKCIRTGDIEEVGDNTHLTFFEMLGNFSFGYPTEENSYFKKESISWAWEFLTKELKIDESRLSATYFKGEGNIPADTESYELIKSITQLPDDKIEGTGKDETFWSLGTEGSPGGPTVEFYVDGVEVWNLVFNQYVMRDGEYVESEYKGIDTGMGLERLCVMMQSAESVYDTDLFLPIIKKLEELSSKGYADNEKAFRIIMDHLRACVFMAAEKLEPSNVDRGYIMRRLIRRAVRYGWAIELHGLGPIVTELLNLYSPVFPELKDSKAILNIINKEEQKFQKTIEDGMKRAKIVFDKKSSLSSGDYAKVMQIDEKGDTLAEVYAGKKTSDTAGVSRQQIMDAFITGEEAFNLYQSFGFPIELIQELAQEKRLFVDKHGFWEEIKKHQELSRTASAGKFKGGLADNKEETTKLHTAAHLLLAALRKVLGPHVMQRGANITEERLRFDFSHPEKVLPEQLAEVEKFVNEQIAKHLPVTVQEMSVSEAKESGAVGIFDDRYGDRVKVYTIGEGEDIVSREICGGPHVENIGNLGEFKITKEESSSSGVRRIKAILS